MTRVLVVGSGSREHAIAWKLLQSPQLEALWVAPGNGGTAAIAENLPVQTNNVEGLVRAARDRRADLVIAGPEEPLALGLADALAKAGIPCLGPVKAAAQIEASKTFAKELMGRASIATASWHAFDDYAAAQAYVASQRPPVVIKADGLAMGKGVAVCQSQGDAQDFLHALMVEKAFGAAGQRVVIEECLTGQEVSAFAFSDGENILPTVPACDYKRVFDGDQGPNTGGMGSYSPPEFLSDRELRWIRERILRGAVQQMAADGRPYRGILYAGLMVVAKGEPRVLEFNCRMGDPEAQAVIPRMDSDLLPIAQAAAAGSLAKTEATWRSEACVAVVLTSGGYPGDFQRGFPISGLDEVDSEVLVFHGGTRKERGRLVTSGGRVLTVAALGATLEATRTLAYENVARIHFEGMHYRKDIALRAVSIVR